MASKTMERIKKRLVKDAPMTMISLRLPQAMIEDLREVAHVHGFSGYQGLIRFYLSKGLRDDLEKLDQPQRAVIAKSLTASGVADDVIERALGSK